MNLLFSYFYFDVIRRKRSVIARMEQAEADANIQKSISLLHPFLVQLILSNPVTSKKGKKKKDFSQSLQAIINDWISFYPAESEFTDFIGYFKRAKQIRHLVAHQSFNCNRYQNDIECLAKIAIAIATPDLTESILKLAIVDKNEKEEEGSATDEKRKEAIFVDTLKEFTSLKKEGNQLYKEERWREAMTCYTQTIHLNQEEAVFQSNLSSMPRTLCQLLSKFDLARENIPFNPSSKINKKTDFSQSLQAIIDDWRLVYPTESAEFRKYFFTAKKVWNLVSRQPHPSTGGIDKLQLHDIILKFVEIEERKKVKSLFLHNQEDCDVYDFPDDDNEVDYDAYDFPDDDVDIEVDYDPYDYPDDDVDNEVDYDAYDCQDDDIHEESGYHRRATSAEIE